MVDKQLSDYLGEVSLGIYGFGNTGQKLVDRLGDNVDRLVVYEDDPSALEDLDHFTESSNKTMVTEPKIFREDLDLLISSPGIPGDHPVIRQVREAGIPVWDELEFSYRLAQEGTFWAITGTNGKSTSADLAGQLLTTKYDEKNVSVCGNRGSPLIEHVLEGGPDSHYVVEVSSFQVEGLDRFTPDGALLTSLGDDHQDYHDSLYEYHSLKWELMKSVRSDGPIIVPANERNHRWLKDRSKVRSFNAHEVLERPIEYEPGTGLRLGEVRVPEGNLDECLTLFPENILGVVALLENELSFEEMREGLETFRSLDYRAGTMKDVNGKKIINDSKGTNPSAVRKLVQRLDSPFRIVLGGGAKETDYRELVDTLLDSQVEAIVLAGTGSTARRLEESLDKVGCDFERFQEWEQAVKSTFERTKPGETIVLSPGGTSFDDFENYRDRGEAFDRWIEEAANEKIVT